MQYNKNNTEELFENTYASNHRNNREHISSIFDNNYKLQKLIRANKLQDVNNNYCKKFNRFGYIDPQNSLKTVREYVFFTKPDLNLLDNNGNLSGHLANIPFFTRVAQTHKELLSLWQRSYEGEDAIKTNFIPLLTNTCRSSLELPSIDGTTLETNGTIYGDKLSYRWTSTESDTNHKFSIEFQEDKYLTLYTFFKIYDEYNKLKCLGKVNPPDIEKYVIRKILHDQFSAFKIIVDEDGETILYFAKCWGVYPMGVPRDIFSNLDDNLTQFKVPITFNATFVEDLDPMIIKDFNIAAGYQYEDGTITDKGYKMLNNMCPIYDKEIDAVSGEWISCPFIVNGVSSNTFGEGIVNYKSKLRGDRMKKSYWKLKFANI